MGAFAGVAVDVMVKHFGLLRGNARRLYVQTSGIPFAQQLEAIFGEHPDNVAAAREFETRKAVIAADAVMDGATLAGVKALRAAGLRLVVSSNGMQSHVETFAARTRGLFDLALGFDGSGLEKGEPHVGVVANRLGVARDRMMFVGDSVRDGQLAHETGLAFVGRAGTFPRHVLERRFPGAPIVDSVGELPALLAA